MEEIIDHSTRYQKHRKPEDHSTRTRAHIRATQQR